MVDLFFESESSSRQSVNQFVMNVKYQLSSVIAFDVTSVQHGSIRLVSKSIEEEDIGHAWIVRQNKAYFH